PTNTAPVTLPLTGAVKQRLPLLKVKVMASRFRTKSFTAIASPLSATCRSAWYVASLLACAKLREAREEMAARAEMPRMRRSDAMGPPELTGRAPQLRGNLCRRARQSQLVTRRE